MYRQFFCRNYDSHLETGFCPASCIIRIYTPYIQNRKEKEMPDGELSVAFSSNLITMMKEVLGYDWNLFLADLGGSLGFLLGVSVLGALGALEKMLKYFLSKKENESENLKAVENNNKKEAEGPPKNLEFIGTKLLNELDDVVLKNQKNKIYDYNAGSNIFNTQSEKDNFNLNKC